jgi:hypothetical protein
MNKVEHYNKGLIQPYQFINKYGFSFNIGNYIKYFSRLGAKEGQSIENDIVKINDYINFEIERFNETTGYMFSTSYCESLIEAYQVGNILKSYNMPDSIIRIFLSLLDDNNKRHQTFELDKLFIDGEMKEKIIKYIESKKEIKQIGIY